MLKKGRSLFHYAVFALCVFLLQACTDDSNSFNVCDGRSTESGTFPERALFSGGMERSYILQVPAMDDPERPMPIVFNFHGFGSNKEQQSGYAALGPIAEENKFILVTPDGIENSWNGGTCCGTAIETGVDDVGFVDDMITEISSEYCVDPNRIYATGMSNGGFMSYRLACDLSDKIAAIGPVAAADGTLSCDSSRPVPVIAFNGTEDVLVDFSGASASIDEWVMSNQCNMDPGVVYEQGDVTCLSYGECAQGATTEFCIVDGGGHTWPGAIDIFALDPEAFPWAGVTTQNVDASQRMWEFFDRHPKPQ